MKVMLQIILTVSTCSAKITDNAFDCLSLTISVLWSHSLSLLGSLEDNLYCFLSIYLTSDKELCLEQVLSLKYTH